MFLNNSVYHIQVADVQSSYTQHIKHTHSKEVWGHPKKILKIRSLKVAFQPLTEVKVAS